MIGSIDQKYSRRRASVKNFLPPVSEEDPVFERIGPELNESMKIYNYIKNLK